MTSPLHKPPQGLMSALNLKTLGQNPDKFGDTVLPTFAVRDLYLADYIRQTENTSVGNLGATSLTLAVDPGALWLLRSLTAIFDYPVNSNSADEQWRWALTYQSPGAASQLTLAWYEVLTSALALPLGAAATYSQRLTFTPSEPMLFLPSTVFRAVCSSTMSAGAGYDSYIRAEFVPLAP